MARGLELAIQVPLATGPTVSLAHGVYELLARNRRILNVDLYGEAGALSFGMTILVDDETNEGITYATILGHVIAQHAIKTVQAREKSA